MNRTALLALGGLTWAGARALRSRRAVSFRDRTVLISGGSRGLGLILARQLADEGARLALFARTAEDLEAAADDLESRTGRRPLVVACDVRQRDAVEAAVARVVDELGPPSVLIHDAGVIEVGPLENQVEADYREALGVHFWGAYYLTEAVRPNLPRDGSGRIGYVSSVAGRVAVPHLGPYSASKHALVGYADTVRAELAADGIRVTTITPGLMRTGSPPNVVVKGDHRKEYAWFALSDANPLVSMDAERAAAKILDALRHGDPALILTLTARVGAALDGLAPGAVGRLTALANRLLPDAVGPAGDRRQSGWDSFSGAAPSALTTLSDRETVENNELRGRSPDALDG